ncbi:MAG: hydrogenase expression/formation protein HypE [Akkermansia sp.]
MFSCPLPHHNNTYIELAYGDGGRLMSQLINDIFLPAFGTDPSSLHDSAVLSPPQGKLAFTTDSFVVHPLFFPGGDIGSLAIHGTINDLAMSGAHPLYISASFILEEGLEIEILRRIVNSMAQAAKQADVRIVTGDTKVVEKGKGDGIYINTSGIGIIEHPWDINATAIQEGDAILISGDIGRHGMTIMSVREELGFSSSSGLTSDSAPLHRSVHALIDRGIPIHCLRDITRGGLSTTLHELADASGLTFLIDEQKIPVREDVRSACDLLGLDPLQVACEGRYSAIVPEKNANQALELMRTLAVSGEACRIGTVQKRDTAPLLMRGILGPIRIISMPTGTQLPRIC